MSDLISRQAAIDALMTILDKPNHAEFLYTDEICKVLNELPSTQPERKKGKWIYGNPSTMKCDQCGYYIANWRQKESNFCPNCGARMEGSAV